MTCAEVGELQSAHFDGELTADELALVRAHLDACPGCRDDQVRIKGASAAARAHFSREEAALPDLKASQETFLRTTLGSGAFPRSVARWTPFRSWVAAAVVLIVAGSILWFLPSDGSVRAASLMQRAAEATLGEREFLEVLVERTVGFGATRKPVTILLAKDGRFLISNPDVLYVPPALGLAKRFRGPLIRAPGKTLSLGSDGTRIWFHIQGNEEVFLLEQKPMPMFQLFDSVLDAGSGGNEGHPLANWAQVLDALERIRRGRLECTSLEDVVVGGEHLKRAEFIFPSRGERTVARLFVKESEPSIRQIDIAFFTFRFSRPSTDPTAATFHWSGAGAKDDAKLVDLRH